MCQGLPAGTNENLPVIPVQSVRRKAVPWCSADEAALARGLPATRATRPAATPRCARPRPRRGLPPRRRQREAPRSRSARLRRRSRLDCLRQRAERLAERHGLGEAEPVIGRRAAPGGRALAKVADVDRPRRAAPDRRVDEHDALGAGPGVHERHEVARALPHLERRRGARRAAAAPRAAPPRRPRGRDGRCR